MFNIPPTAEVAFFIQASGEKKKFLEKEKPLFKKLLRASRIEIMEKQESSSPMPSEVTELATISMELDKNLIDFEAEKKKLSSKMADISAFIESVSKKLSNEKFLAKANPQAVENEKTKHRQAVEELEKLKTVFQFFK